MLWPRLVQVNESSVHQLKGYNINATRNMRKCDKPFMHASGMSRCTPTRASAYVDGKWLGADQARRTLPVPLTNAVECS